MFYTYSMRACDDAVWGVLVGSSSSASTVRLAGEECANRASHHHTRTQPPHREKCAKRSNNTEEPNIETPHHPF
ncbi:hypothetical protein EJ05DRAFT_477683 [Pseudovirgaria hyperparasitica]|uniref:Uncharacterized protein n=1 Tax=Pseudovirgaria hyperparasitica TaxID=470096 RepID=A0A6A6W1Y6_9PEZI|nr:uncharacterized protein EJ05DRAFT_477683 [Pseudovirgaria hyperparasitica]KAF2756563.1 hypothetical protein EJ05DRAFT_477683 [Pseudovirgaria hyperparasitica]